MNPLISNIEGKRQYFQQQYGNKIERTLLDITDAWKELEADPELFSLLARDLAGEEIDVVEVYDIHRDLKTFLGSEEKVYGLVFLFECKEGGNDRSQRLYNKELHKKFFLDETVINTKMFFAHQKAPNSCGTHALLSILLNSEELQLNRLLQDFKNFTREMPPEARGYAIGNSGQLAAFHNRRAPASTEVVATVTSNTRRTVEAPRSRYRTYSRQNHFVPYVPIDGHLMELDGLKDNPICHGPVTPEDWIEKCQQIILHRISSNTSKRESDRHSILAVKASRRTRCVRELSNIEESVYATLDRITALVEEGKSYLPSQCREFVSGTKRRSTSFAKSPPDITAVVIDDTPLCGQIIALLETAKEKLDGDILEQNKLVQSFVQLIPPSPIKNGYCVEKELAKTYSRSLSSNCEAIPRHASSDPDADCNANSCCPAISKSGDSKVLVVSGMASPNEWVTKAQVWPTSVALCTQPDLTILNDLEALSRDYMKKTSSMETRRQRAAARNMLLAGPKKPIIPLKIIRSKAARKSPALNNGPSQVNTVLRLNTGEICQDSPVMKKNKILQKCPSVVLTAPETVENGNIPGRPGRLLTRITRIGGRLRSSSVTQPSKSLSSESTVVIGLSAPIIKELIGPVPMFGLSDASVDKDSAEICRKPSKCLSSSLSCPGPDRKTTCEKNGYVSIVRNPLIEARNKLESLESQCKVVVQLQVLFGEVFELEKRIPGLQSGIIEEDAKREAIAKNAVDREFPHGDYITRIIKRFFELKMLSKSEILQILPAANPHPPFKKPVSSTESDESLSLLPSSGSGRRPSSNNELSIVAKKRRS